MSESRRGVTRLLVADAIDDYDDQLADLQEMKKAVYQNYRAALASRGFSKLAISAEVSTLKLAIRQRRNIEKDAEAAKARRGLFDEILTEITAAPSRARAHAREEDHRDPSAEIAELVADEVAAAETAAKLAEEETTPEERRKAQIKAAADRAEARSRGGAARTH